MLPLIGVLPRYFQRYYDARIYHFDGEKWTRIWIRTCNGVDCILTDIWGVAPNDMFAIGRAGGIYHFDGTAWSIMDSDTGNSLNGIWGTSSDDISIVGSKGTIIQYVPVVVASPELVVTQDGYTTTF
jgi:hypothetical protein